MLIDRHSLNHNLFLNKYRQFILGQSYDTTLHFEYWELFQSDCLLNDYHFRLNNELSNKISRNEDRKEFLNMMEDYQDFIND